MVDHFTMRTFWVNQAFRFVAGIWLHRKSRQIRTNKSEKPSFTSYVQIMLWFTNLYNIPWFCKQMLVSQNVLISHEITAKWTFWTLNRQCLSAESESTYCTKESSLSPLLYPWLTLSQWGLFSPRETTTTKTTFTTMQICWKTRKSNYMPTIEENKKSYECKKLRIKSDIKPPAKNRLLNAKNMQKILQIMLPFL